MNTRSISLRVLKAKQRAFYQSIESVHCPILNEDVAFTSEGFNHLLFESNRKPRKLSEQYLKLCCLDYAKEVIEKCVVISQTRVINRKIKGVEKTVTRYGLVHQISDGRRIRVILERIGDGKLKFLSVMPHDKSSKKPKKTP